jgi:hypothetical protein
LYISLYANHETTWTAHFSSSWTEAKCMEDHSPHKLLKYISLKLKSSSKHIQNHQYFFLHASYLKNGHKFGCVSHTNKNPFLNKHLTELSPIESHLTSWHPLWWQENAVFRRGGKGKTN